MIAYMLSYVNELTDATFNSFNRSKLHMFWNIIKKYPT